MHPRDFFVLAWRSVVAHPMRSLLTLAGIAVGVAAVILLTSIGEGIHRFVLAEFTQFGTHVIQVTPGRRGTRGGPPGLPSTARALTLDDAAALARLAGVRAATPVVFGNSEVQGNGRSRRTTIYGVGAAFPDVFAFAVASGRFLPPDEGEGARAFVVLGAKVKQELFGDAPALGQRVRIAGERFRVIGVMAPKGQVLGTDLDDTLYLPAARALALYNREGLMEINLAYREEISAARMSEDIRRLMIGRHGREDFTLTTQEDMLRTLSRILDVLTLAVGALGGISLLVGAVGIVTVMTIAVTERTAEIGLLVALGARRRTILGLFLGEAVLLSGAGGLAGLALGGGLAQALAWLVPALPVATPWQFALAALAVSILIGLVAGVWPANKAARLDPVEALRSP